VAPSGPVAAGLAPLGRPGPRRARRVGWGPGCLFAQDAAAPRVRASVSPAFRTSRRGAAGEAPVAAVRRAPGRPRPPGALPPEAPKDRNTGRPSRPRRHSPRSRTNAAPGGPGPRPRRTPPHQGLLSPGRLPRPTMRALLPTSRLAWERLGPALPPYRVGAVSDVRRTKERCTGNKWGRGRQTTCGSLSSAPERLHGGNM